MLVKKNTYKKYLGITVILFFIFFIQTSFVYEADAQTIQTTNPQLQVDLPGYAFAELQKQNGGIQVVDEAGGGKSLYISWIALYIGGIYQFAIYASAIVAVVVIMGAGFVWLTSQGNQSTISKAKEYVANAVIGLLILMSSYVILFTVSPSLVKLQPIRLKLPNDVSLIQSCEQVEKDAKTAGASVTFSPTKPSSKDSCGTKSTIKVSSEAGFPLASNQCYWNFCPEGKTCSVNSSGVGTCLPCGGFSESILVDAGLPTTTQTCMKFKQKDVGEMKYYCVWNDNGLKNDCYEIQLNCAEIIGKGCPMYDAIAGNDFANFEMICESDPCKASQTTGCVAADGEFDVDCSDK